MSKPDSNSILTHDRYTSVVVPLGAKVDSSTIHAPRRTKGKFTTWAGRLAATFTVAMVAMLGFVQQSQPAEAGFWDPIVNMICGTRESSLIVERHDSGLRALNIGDPFLQSLGYEKSGNSSDFTAYRHTAYEKYGMSGTNFTAYYGKKDSPSGTGRASYDKGNDPRTEIWSCFPYDRSVPNDVANMIFSVNKLVTGVSIWVYGQALNPGWVDPMMDAASLIITGDKNTPGLRDGLYFNMLGLVILSSAIYLMGPLFKRQFMNVSTNVIWLLGAAGFGTALMYAPAFLPSLGQAVVTEFTTLVHDTTTGAVLGKVGGDKANNFCYVASDVPKKLYEKNGLSASTVKNVRAMECSMWAVFVYSPWVAGQFGVSSAEAGALLSGGTGPNHATVADKTEYAVYLGNKVTIKNNLALAQLDKQSLDAYDVARGITEQDNSTYMRNTNQSEWYAIADEVMLDMPEISTAWSGETSINRIAIAFTAILASLLGLIIVVVSSASLLVYQVGIILLVAISPLFLLMGAHAGFGRGITFKWLSMLASMYLKTAFTALFLGIAMLFYAIITQLQAGGQLGYGMGMLAIIIISIGMLVYRKPLIDMFAEVNIPGSRGSIGLETPSGLKSAGSTAKNVAIGAGFGALGAMGASKVAAKAAAGNAKAAATAKAAAAGEKLSPKALNSIGSTAAGKARMASLWDGVKSGAGSRAAGIEGLMASRIGMEAAHRVASRHEEQAQQRAAMASASADSNDPTLIARRAREEAAASRKYANDFKANAGNEAWVQGFQKTYGITPPNPETHIFPGYGKRFDLETDEGKAQWERYKPRPRPLAATPAPTPADSGMAAPIPTRTSTRNASEGVPTVSVNRNAIPPVTSQATPPVTPQATKTLPPAFAQMNVESAKLREMEEKAPAQGTPGWDQHQRMIGEQQRKVWALQDQVGLHNLKRMRGNVKLVSGNTRPVMPQRPNL